MAWRSRSFMAERAQQASQQGAVLVADGSATGVAVALQERLGLLEQLVGYDGLVLAVMDLVLVLDLANVGDVGEQRIEAVLGEQLAAALRSLLGPPAFGRPATAVQLRDRGQQRLVFEIQLEYLPHALGFDLVHRELRVLYGVSENRHATRPFTLVAGGGDLVADALADHLAFELGE